MALQTPFGKVEDTIVKEICNRLKAAVTSTLCRLLQQTIKDTVEKHSTKCKAKCQRDVEQPRAYERPRIHVRSIAPVFMVGLVVVALLAVTLATPGPALLLLVALAAPIPLVMILSYVTPVRAGPTPVMPLLLPLLCHSYSTSRPPLPWRMAQPNYRIVALQLNTSIANVPTSPTY